MTVQQTRAKYLSSTHKFFRNFSLIKHCAVYHDLMDVMNYTCSFTLVLLQGEIKDCSLQSFAMELQLCLF